MKQSAAPPTNNRTIKERIAGLPKVNNTPREAALGAALVVLLLIFHLISGGRCFAAQDYKGEQIIYSINPVGRAEYNDMGIVELEGKKVNLSTFRTRVMGFDDTEKIYTDPVSFLPVRVERDISMWLDKEYIIEKYDQKNFRLVVNKFKGKKNVQEYIFKEKGPIYNAIMLGFYLRRITNLNPGWSLEVRFPNTFTIKLAAIEEINVPAGTFKAYHFTSEPAKFEIWVSADQLRIPLKIKGQDNFSYTMLMQKRDFK